MGKEEVVQILPGGHRRCRQVEQLGAWRAYKGHGEPVGLHLVISVGCRNCLLVCLKKGGRIWRPVVERRHLQLELGRPRHLPQGEGEAAQPRRFFGNARRPGRRRSARHRSQWHDLEVEEEDSDAPLPGAPNVELWDPQTLKRFEL